ncbi:MAG: transposase [Bacteroidota bacterium]
MRERKRNRKFGFDYSTEAKYFLTICTDNRICHFGNVENGEMILNEFGEIADNQILWLEQQYPYFLIHNHIVMPNHLHILCEIIPNSPVRTGRDLSPQSLPKIKSISELMGAFKTTSSKKIHLAGNTDFKWQRSFHDHIIRNNTSYENIFNYISENPAKWTEDLFIKE